MAQQSASSLLRALREGRAQSLRAAASDLGVAPSHLSRLERGEVTSSSDLRQRVAAYYGVDTDLLALAEGRVPPDIVAILQAHPELLSQLRSEYASAAGVPAQSKEDERP